MKSAQSQEANFETLCYVKADISSAPYTSRYTTTGKMGYRRECDIILLVGLTELKVQVCWIDSRTVRAYFVMHVFHLPHPVSIYANPEDGEEVRSSVF